MKKIIQLAIAASMLLSSAGGFAAAPETPQFKNVASSYQGSSTATWIEIKFNLKRKRLNRVEWEFRVDGQKRCEGNLPWNGSNAWEERSCNTQYNFGQHTVQIRACTRSSGDCSSSTATFTVKTPAPTINGVQPIYQANDGQSMVSVAIQPSAIWQGPNYANNWTLQVNGVTKCQDTRAVASWSSYSMNCGSMYGYGTHNVTLTACNPTGCYNAQSVSFVVMPPEPVLEVYSTHKETSPGSGAVVPFDISFWGSPNSSNYWSVTGNGSMICNNTVQGGWSQIKDSCSKHFTLGTHTLKLTACSMYGCIEKTRIVRVIKDPRDYLDTSHWETRKLNGMSGSNAPYNNNDGKNVAAYYTEWSVYARKFYPKNIPVENLTHLYHSFIAICGQSLNQSALHIQNDNIALEAQLGTPNNTFGRPYDALAAACAGKQNYEVAIHDRDASILSAGWINGGKLDPSETSADPIRGIYAEYYRMKMTFPHIKILASVGGYTLSDPFFTMTWNKKDRATFIASMINFVHEYDFYDGIDLDWEFPGGGGAEASYGLGLSSALFDGQKFAILVKELREAMDVYEAKTGRHLELHAAVGVSGRDDTGGAYIGSIYWEQAGQYLDHINVMSYDFRGAWNKVYGHHTALYESQKNSDENAADGLNADDAVNVLLNRGVPANKINLGVAMYGRGWGSQRISGIPYNPNQYIWQPGIQDYKGIEQHVLPYITEYNPDGSGYGYGGVPGNPNAMIYHLTWDDQAKAQMFKNSYNGTLITFDSAKSVIEKGKYSDNNGLGGVFAWSIDGDSGTLLNAMHEGLGHPQQ